MGCGEEEVRAGGCFDVLVAVELGAVVDGDGTDTTSGIVDELDGTPVGGLDGSSGELTDDGEASLTVDEREQAVLVGTENCVSLEVSNAGTILGAWRSLRDRLLTGEPSSGIIAAVAFAAFLACTAQVAVEGASTPFVHPDVAVDGLVTDGEQAESAKPAADLLWTEVLSQPRFDELPVARGEALIATGLGASPARFLACRVPAIATVFPSITLEFPVDRAAMATQGVSDRRRPESLFPQGRERISLFRGELVVGPHE